MLFVNWLLSFIWKIAFFGGHGSLSLSLSSASEVYRDRSAWKWQRRIFLAVEGCAWRYLVRWRQAVCQNCCWFPKHLLMFASSMPWSFWLVLRPRLPGAWLCITFYISSRDCARCRRSGCCCSCPSTALQVCSCLPSHQQEVAGMSVCPRAGEAESSVFWLLVLDALTVLISSSRTSWWCSKGQHIPNAPLFDAFLD